MGLANIKTLMSQKLDLKMKHHIICDKSRRKKFPLKKINFKGKIIANDKIFGKIIQRGRWKEKRRENIIKQNDK